MDFLLVQLHFTIRHQKDNASNRRKKYMPKTNKSKESKGTVPFDFY
jgi:hypothetical protein